MNIKLLYDGVSHYLVKRLFSNYRLFRKWLESTQWMTKNELDDLQLKLLSKIITYSYQNIPYYNTLFKHHGIKPYDIKTLDDVDIIPILNKKTILKNSKEFVSTKYNPFFLRKAATSGSTGTPLVLYRNYRSIGIEHAFVRRQWEWAGLNLNDKCAVLKGRIIGRINSDRKVYDYDPFMKELYLSGHHLSNETALYYADLMRDHNVSGLFGFPSAISFIAKKCLEKNHPIKLKAVLTTSEVLSSGVKDVIQKGFRCPVFDFYGAAERAVYIHTCDKGKYHIIPEYGYTELLPVDNDERFRRVISTGFWNYAMPLIRYDTGDVVEISDQTCCCGRNFPIIQKINGRTGDVIISPSGKRLGPGLMHHILYVLCGSEKIAETQIIQDAKDHLTILYVPMEGFSETLLADFSRSLSRYIPEDLCFDFKKIEKIKKTESGKIKALVSNI